MSSPPPPGAAVLTAPAPGAAESGPPAPGPVLPGLPPPVDVGESQPLENDFQKPVAGENNYDDGALHPNQVAALQRHLAALRRDNEAYLARHGELKTLVSDFIAGIVDQQPDDVRDFAAQFFAEANQRKKKEAAEGGDGEQEG